jgi:adenylate cyclase
LALGLFVGAIGIAASAALARTLTTSMADLVKGTQRVATGQFDVPIEIDSGDEIGDLATSFNIMMLGLREHSNMKKFLSHSTMEMIQAQLSQQYAAGERKTITVVFTDMRGFTATTEKCPPEKAVELLNSCLSLQADLVKHFRGDVDKFVGDCVMALFDGKDSTLRAIRCAVEIEQALAAQDSGEPCEPPVQVGIGIVTGEVILGSIGSEDRRDFTAVGPNVNLCARLCSMAGPGEILLSASTYREVENLVAAEPTAPLTLKGFSEPIPVYRICPQRKGAGLLRQEAP